MGKHKPTNLTRGHHCSVSCLHILLGCFAAEVAYRTTKTWIKPRILNNFDNRHTETQRNLQLINICWITLIYVDFLCTICWKELILFLWRKCPATTSPTMENRMELPQKKVEKQAAKNTFPYRCFMSPSRFWSHNFKTHHRPRNVELVSDLLLLGACAASGDTKIHCGAKQNPAM